jgi:hypothetical protein
MIQVRRCGSSRGRQGCDGRGVLTMRGWSGDEEVELMAMLEASNVCSCGVLRSDDALDRRRSNRSWVDATILVS